MARHARAVHLRVDDTIGAVLEHPAFAGFGRLLLPWDEGGYDTTMRRVTSYEPFLDGGFLPNRDSGAPGNWDATRAALGRPVDVLQLPDG